jgi:hypothetical protein
MTFDHVALNLTADKNLVYTAMSKYLFYFRMHISKYVFEQNKVPLNPFMMSEYFLVDTVERNIIRESNNILVKRADEFWVFGTISNGVLAELKIAQKMNKPIKYFKIENSKTILPISVDEVEMEDDVKEFKKDLKIENLPTGRQVKN